jgi:hypothetical protein
MPQQTPQSAKKALSSNAECLEKQADTLQIFAEANIKIHPNWLSWERIHRIGRAESCRNRNEIQNKYLHQN